MTQRKNPKDFLPLGRPTKYKPEYCEAIIKFFSRPRKKIQSTIAPDGTVVNREVSNDLPQMIDFAMSIDVDRDTLNEWCKVHPDFSDAYKKALDLQASFVTENSINGDYKQPFAIFFMKNCHGWKDKTEHEIGDKTLDAFAAMRERYQTSPAIESKTPVIEGETIGKLEHN